jgi:predicted component of type VI protein secretion system
MVPQLIPLDGTNPIAVDKPILFFGRHPDCDVVLVNSRKVSRKHCCLAVIDNYLVIRDLGSMNGLRVNGQPVRKEARVNIGDEFHVGDVGFKVELAPTDRRRGGGGTPAAGAGSGDPAAAKARPRVPPKVDARFLSQDLPVAIPEEVVNFSVEETQKRIPAPPRARKPDDSDEVIELRDSDVVED